MTDQITIKIAQTKADYARCIQIRTQVFVCGQNVPPAREIDDHEDSATHILVLENTADNAQPLGAARWRLAEKGIAKIERMAVLENARGKKIGAQMLVYIIDNIKKSGTAKQIILGAQDHAIDFYQRMGFEIHGEGYIDGGTIPHHDMILELK